MNTTILFKDGKYVFESPLNSGEFSTLELFCVWKANLKTDYKGTSYIQGELAKKFMWPTELQWVGQLEPFDLGWKDKEKNVRVTYSQYVIMLDNILYYGHTL